MNGKLSKALRKLEMTTKKDKKYVYGLSSQERFALRLKARAIKNETNKES